MSSYEDGFGCVNGEYWMGLILIKYFMMTLGLNKLNVNLADWDGVYKVAIYQDFKLAGADDNYRATIGMYMGDVGRDGTYVVFLI